MPPRLTAKDRRQQILEVAFGLFARKGYEGATTREIAEKAGINEALLFRHFSSKENLYWTMIEEVCQPRGRRQRIQRLLDAGGTDFEVFQGIAREDRKSTRLNSSHLGISYAVFCLKKKKQNICSNSQCTTYITV